MNFDKRKYLNELYEKENDGLVKFLIRKLGNLQESEDVAHEAYIRFSNMDPSIEVKNPRALLYKIASNIAIDHLRKNQRINKREVPEEQAGYDNYLESESPPIERVVTAEQQLALLIESLNDLPPKTQRIFIMHKFKEMGYSEIAENLAISKKTVEYHMTQALLHLRGV